MDKNSNIVFGSFFLSLSPFSAFIFRLRAQLLFAIFIFLVVVVVVWVFFLSFFSGILFYLYFPFLVDSRYYCLAHILYLSWIFIRIYSNIFQSRSLFLFITILSFLLLFPVYTFGLLLLVLFYFLHKDRIHSNKLYKTVFYHFSTRKQKIHSENFILISCIVRWIVISFYFWLFLSLYFTFFQP